MSGKQTTYLIIDSSLIKAKSKANFIFNYKNKKYADKTYKRMQAETIQKLQQKATTSTATLSDIGVQRWNTVNTWISVQS